MEEEMDGGRTTMRQYSEYSENFQQHNENTIGTISGISHRMDQIARRLVVTFRRATMIGLRRKNILIYLHPDDHMLDMWQKDYVLQLDSWRKQWSGCSRNMTDYRTEFRLRTQTLDSGLQTPDSGLRIPEEENSVIPKSGPPHNRYVIEGYVLQLDNWRKQWSGCSRTLQITVRSSNSVGHILRRSLLGTGTVYRQPWKLRP